MGLLIVFGIVMVAFFALEVVCLIRDIRKRKREKAKELQEVQENEEI